MTTVPVPDRATDRALAAVRAAKNFHRWGTYAAARYCRKRGVPQTMIAMAFLYEARRRAIRKELAS